MANVTGSFTATGQSASFKPRVDARSTFGGQFNVSLTGTAVGSVQLEASFDNGTTWCEILAGGAQIYAWTYDGTNLTERAEECEQGVIYRLNCTAYTSGTISYRLSQ